MARGRLLGGCAWLLGGLALLQTLYLRALPPPRPAAAALRPRRPPRGVLDASGAFRVYWDVLGPPPGWASAPRPELVLATHGTPGRAAAALGGPWGGPLSVAVFGVPRGGLEELMAILGGPCRGLRGRLRLHVVLGAAGPPPRPPNLPRAPQNPAKFPQNPGGGCRGALERLAAADPPSYSLGVPYPGNLLRNVAWEGAAAGGHKGGAPPGFGGRWVLLVDADVVPSPGLHEGFLELLRDGGLHPKTWGGQGDPNDLGPQRDLGAQGDFGDPRALGAPGGLRVPNMSGIPSIPGGPNGLKDPKALEDPKGLSDHGVPNALEVPNVLNDPSDPKDPNALEVPKGLRDLGVPNIPKNPSALENPKNFQDPGVPNVLEAPNTLEDPNVPKNPNTLGDPNALSDPDATEPPWARVVFVLPAFEVRGGRRLPGTKAELLRLWGAGDARPFYGMLCPRCQAPTEFGRWRALPPPPRLHVAYEVPWRDPWEPFFVAPAHGIPPFDERFLQYGFNRISQACELHVAGFRFAVLDGAFVTHRGFKEPGGFHGAREAELVLNRRLFRAFRAELAQRYPGSPRHC
ncbi:beta-1,4-glucuronyltransferase 1 [Aphelocoma coerulescens]|uniref:beta-1,4-glucuronyltransferase 1 n=1 Tax=Aphelocoma coerulescens TaxID=39617 RepID=UPI0036047616